MPLITKTLMWHCDECENEKENHVIKIKYFDNGPSVNAGKTEVFNFSAHGYSLEKSRQMIEEERKLKQALTK